MSCRDNIYIYDNTASNFSVSSLIFMGPLNSACWSVQYFGNKAVMFSVICDFLLFWSDLIK